MAWICFLFSMTALNMQTLQCTVTVTVTRHDCDMTVTVTVSLHDASSEVVCFICPNISTADTMETKHCYQPFCLDYIKFNVTDISITSI